MSTPPAPGLRERKRAETRLRLEQAAVELVQRDGLERLTVDAIAARADVSSRTFFNYFDSKEDAILGIHDENLTDAVVAHHLDTHDHSDPVASVVAFLATIWLPAAPEAAELHEARMAIAEQHPELLGRQLAQINRMGEAVGGTVRAIVERSGRFAGSATTPEQAVSTMLGLCTGTLHAVVREWLAGDRSRPFTSLADDAVARARTVLTALL
ncbi:TetR/AcrR family transcriptional regulator [Sanguibacter suaedae]|uniref:TetR family transcriptional regulator n=1 Tax=Sanguibacter suaedae TaxID=2795737 RepID=A0A934I8Z3_9MICO|nr:TetR/AcrR family transcriptional regulator [Sanguibacter suaedae]MBI9113543.1 TetR family transcriptional regulator [Sanguibacter suaedae]